MTASTTTTTHHTSDHSPPPNHPTTQPITHLDHSHFVINGLTPDASLQGIANQLRRYTKHFGPTLMLQKRGMTLASLQHICSVAGPTAGVLTFEPWALPPSTLADPFSTPPITPIAPQQLQSPPSPIPSSSGSKVACRQAAAAATAIAAAIAAATVTISPAAIEATPRVSLLLEKWRVLDPAKACAAAHERKFLDVLKMHLEHLLISHSCKHTSNATTTTTTEDGVKIESSGSSILFLREGVASTAAAATTTPRKSSSKSKKPVLSGDLFGGWGSRLLARHLREAAEAAEGAAVMDAVGAEESVDGGCRCGRFSSGGVSGVGSDGDEGREGFVVEKTVVEEKDKEEEEEEVILLLRRDSEAIGDKRRL